MRGSFGFWVKTSLFLPAFSSVLRTVADSFNTSISFKEANKITVSVCDRTLSLPPPFPLLLGEVYENILLITTEC